MTTTRRGLLSRAEFHDLESVPPEAEWFANIDNDKTRRAKEQTIYATIIERKPLPVHTTDVPNLSVVPSHILLSNTDIELTTAKDHREARLKTELDKIRDQYDFIFIDNPPALGWLTLNSLSSIGVSRTGRA